MAQFEKLQDLWQRQSAAPAIDAGHVVQMLRAYGRRQAYVIAAKAMVVTAVLAWGITRSEPSPRIIAGFVLVILGTAILLVREVRGQRAIARLEFGAASTGFVRSTMDRLYRQHAEARRSYWPFMVSMVLGLNLILSSAASLWARALASSLPFFAFELGMWVRRKRFEAESRPLVEQLTKLRAAFEDDVHWNR